MKETVDEKRIGDYLIEIFPDYDPDNPRMWDNLGTMICFHKRYSLGDKHNYDYRDYDSWEKLEKAIVKNENAGVILPLYLYDHGMVAMNTTGFICPWDSGQVGFIYVSKKKMLEEYIGKIVTKKLKERVTEYLKAEVITYDQYLRGDVYRYEISRITTCDQRHDHKEELESCRGYYGKDECMEAAEGIVQNYIKEETEKVA
jgi:hypothetical protein